MSKSFSICLGGPVDEFADFFVSMVRRLRQANDKGHMSTWKINDNVDGRTIDVEVDSPDFDDLIQNTKRSDRCVSVTLEVGYANGDGESVNVNYFGREFRPTTSDKRGRCYIHSRLLSLVDVDERDESSKVDWLTRIGGWNDDRGFQGLSFAIAYADADWSGPQSSMMTFHKRPRDFLLDLARIRHGYEYAENEVVNEWYEGLDADSAETLGISDDDIQRASRASDEDALWILHQIEEVLPQFRVHDFGNRGAILENMDFGDLKRAYSTMREQLFVHACKPG